MGRKMKIWCVEDDAGIRDIEVYTFQSMGHEARGFAEGNSFFAALRQEIPDLVILDIMLPEEDGVSILRRLRKAPQTRDLPIIMATAKDQEYDKIESLDLGADDYLVKPFGMMEMVSRAKAVLRRCTPKLSSKILRNGRISLDAERREVLIDGSSVTLTYKEFELLQLFMSSPGQVFTRSMLLDLVWGVTYQGESRTVDVHIRTLRQKLGEEGSGIQTVRNVGYRLQEEKV